LNGYCKEWPIASYAIEEILPFFSNNDLDKIESVKTRYFKRVLGLSKYNRSRFVFALLDFDLFVSDFKQKLALPETIAFEKFCEANLVKQTEICDELCLLGIVFIIIYCIICI
jgi:hypothetical protein